MTVPCTLVPPAASAPRSRVSADDLVPKCVTASSIPRLVRKERSASRLLSLDDNATGKECPKGNPASQGPLCLPVLFRYQLASVVYSLICEGIPT